MSLLSPGGPLARALAADRAGYNARFSRALAGGARLDPDAFSRHLCLRVQPIVEATAGHEPASAPAVSEALYDLSLALCGKELFGRFPALALLWEEYLPALAPALCEAPRRVGAALSNAVINLAAEASGRPRPWLAVLRALAPRCASADELLRVGQVLVWRCGLAHYRQSALDVWRTLPHGLQLGTLGLRRSHPSPPTTAQLETQLEDPWHPPGPVPAKEPGRRLALVGRVGHFRGVSGPFLAPPQVMAVSGRIFALDNEACYALHADCFGATLKRFGPALPAGEESAGAFTLAQDGEVRRGALRAHFMRLAGSSSHASDPHTLAVTLPQSHRLFVVAVVPGQPAAVTR